MGAGRKPIYNRRQQEVVKFRTDQITKRQLQNLCSVNDITMQEFLEKLIKEKIVEFHTTSQKN